MTTFRKTQKIHAYLGLFLLAPLLAWSITGAIFLLKPNWGSAYERISIKTYPMHDRITITPDAQWQEFRLLNSILGHHLLVKQEGVWRQLDITTHQPKSAISTDEEQLLLNDAISVNPDRYGVIEKRSETTFITTTGVELNLNWADLSISQKGKDTKLINMLYKIHYLQWLAIKPLNVTLGALGLVGLVLLTALGVTSYIQRKGKA